MQGTNRTIARLTRGILVVAIATLAVALLAIGPAGAAKRKPLPTLHTLPPYGVNDTEAILNGRINAHGREAVYRFEWGHTKRYGHITEVPEEPLYPFEEPQEFEEYVGDLSPHTAYHCRVVAFLGKKEIFSNDIRFRTQRVDP